MMRVLSLDDDPEMLKLLGLMFDLAGYEHLRVMDGDRALEVLRKEPIDLFTQDCMRPDLDGLALYEQLKTDEDLERVPVLFISAGRRPAFAEECWAIHGDGYLIKPFGPSDLLAAVKEVLVRHGKRVPTAEERAVRYRQVQARLRAEFGWSTEQLDAACNRVNGRADDD